MYSDSSIVIEEEEEEEEEEGGGGGGGGEGGKERNIWREKKQVHKPPSVFSSFSSSPLHTNGSHAHCHTSHPDILSQLHSQRKKKNKTKKQKNENTKKSVRTSTPETMIQKQLFVEN